MSPIKKSKLQQSFLFDTETNKKFNDFNKKWRRFYLDKSILINYPAKYEIETLQIRSITLSDRIFIKPKFKRSRRSLSENNNRRLYKVINEKINSFSRKLIDKSNLDRKSIYFKNNRSISSLKNLETRSFESNSDFKIRQATSKKFSKNIFDKKLSASSSSLMLKPKTSEKKILSHSDQTNLESQLIFSPQNSSLKNQNEDSKKSKAKIIKSNLIINYSKVSDNLNSISKIHQKDSSIKSRKNKDLNSKDLKFLKSNEKLSPTPKNSLTLFEDKDKISQTKDLNEPEKITLENEDNKIRAENLFEKKDSLTSISKKKPGNYRKWSN